jgi:hypothetical protein
MAARTILATLDGPAPHERLQVALVQRSDGRLVFDLRQQHHADGIGWYDQRGLELDPRQLRQLQAVLGSKAARVVDEPDATPVILPVPGPRVADPLRPAVGDRS